MGSKNTKHGKKAAVLALLLLLAVSGLYGCGKDKKAAEPTAGKAKKETAAMAVGKESVSFAEANSYAYFLRKQYNSGIGNEIWSYKLKDGEDLEDFAKKQIQNLITQVKVIKQEAAKQEIELTDDEKDEALQDAVNYLEQVSEEDRKSYGITKELLTGIYEEGLLAQKFYEISTNDADSDISDDEVREVTVQYLLIMTNGTNKEGKAVELSEKEKQAAYKKAKKLHKKSKKGSNFLSLAQSNTDADEVELTFSKENLPEEFGEAAFALKTGELSEVIEGTDGYYVLSCVSAGEEAAIKAKKEMLVKERQEEAFRKKYQNWIKEYDIVISDSLWKKISIA